MEGETTDETSVTANYQIMDESVQMYLQQLQSRIKLYIQCRFGSCDCII